ncbi:hypothetical protein NUSPORA_01045 [Nucleospora cyclopteri]
MMLILIRKTNDIPMYFTHISYYISFLFCSEKNTKNANPQSNSFDKANKLYSSNDNSNYDKLKHRAVDKLMKTFMNQLIHKSLPECETFDDKKNE